MTTKLLNISEIDSPTASFGNLAACKKFAAHNLQTFIDRKVNVNSYGIALIGGGSLQLDYCSKELHLSENMLAVIPPFKTISLQGYTPDSLVSTLFIDPDYFEQIFAADENMSQAVDEVMLDKSILVNVQPWKFNEMMVFYNQIERTIKEPHIYRKEMLQSFIHIFQMYIAGMISPAHIVTPDFKHKSNIYKIFVHLARNHFRKERQLHFYADKMNISQAYLSRTVKEISGNTVLNYLSTLLYNEICKQLLNEDKTISEIAFGLNFSDQSALTNFFKQKAGVSPAAYRESHAY